MNELKKIDRLIEIISLMRDKNQNLNYKLFKRLAKSKVSQKTFLRDIAYLRDCHGVPIEYDGSEKVFYLKNLFFDTSFLNSGNPHFVILSTRLAETVLPEPLKSEVRRTMNAAILEYNEDLKTEDDYSCFVAAFDQRVEYDSNIVQAVFKSSVSCCDLELEYQARDGRIRKQIFSPHFMVERQGIWYLHGKLHQSDGKKLKTARVLTLALHRIKSIRILDTFFTRDDKLRETIIKEGLFDFEKIINVKIHCSSAIRQSVIEQHEHNGDEIIKNADGSLLLTIKSIPKRQVIKWIFAEHGNAKVLEPKALAIEICKIAQKITSTHGGEKQ
ncbi:MAG: WYL domain-containing protein [Victivallaceae bacterium]|nr:WYL domain-containing protein [Victivallaceae bacterium]